MDIRSLFHGLMKIIFRNRDQSLDFCNNSITERR